MKTFSGPIDEFGIRHVHPSIWSDIGPLCKSLLDPDLRKRSSLQVRCSLSRRRSDHGMRFWQSVADDFKASSPTAAASMIKLAAQVACLLASPPHGHGRRSSLCMETEASPAPRRSQSRWRVSESLCSFPVILLAAVPCIALIVWADAAMNVMNLMWLLYSKAVADTLQRNQSWM